ncbi:MAG: hypothetical protein HFG73_04860 [Hungatella sp.]|nr:hypothetical protein [Hungatella sp.]
MSKSERYVSALEERGLFENSGHKTRFKELVDCYGHYPFFTKGLCKCMYLSAWDQEHFAVILQALADLAIGRERDTGDMRAQGDVLAEMQKDGEYYVYQLSNAFLDGKPFVLKEGTELSEDFLYIIRRALEAEKVIEQADPL